MASATVTTLAAWSGELATVAVQLERTLGPEKFSLPVRRLPCLVDGRSRVSAVLTKIFFATWRMLTSDFGCACQGIEARMCQMRWSTILAVAVLARSHSAEYRHPILVCAARAT